MNITNSKEFDQKLFNTGRLFKVTETNFDLFQVIQKHRSDLSIEVDFDQIRSQASIKYSPVKEQLYFSTDFYGLYLIDEVTLKMVVLSSSLDFSTYEKSWIKYISDEKNSIRYLVQNSSSLEQLTKSLFAKIVSTPKSQLTDFLDILLSKLDKFMDDKNEFNKLKSELIVFTRKQLEVSFSEFDNKFTNQLSYQYLDEDKNIKIYRGENKNSQSFRNTYSWTTNKQIAYDFAKMFDGGRILETTISKNKLLYVYEDDGECEVLVKPSDLGKVKSTLI